MIALNAFAPVTLESLVAQAALLTRVDRKYLLPLDTVADVVSHAAPRVRVLDIDGSRDFAYDSVYFDTPDFLAYRLTALRRRRRFKLRTRTYLDTGGSYLELKTKSGRGTTVKERMPYAPIDRARITPSGGAYAADLLAQRGHEPSLVAEMRPSLVSRYRRSTLLLPDGSRATIDTDLRWSDPDGRALSLPGYAIVESKSPGRPNDLDRALWRTGHRPSGISKFGTGTAALHPELPVSKWARTLRGPFSESILTTAPQEQR
ncbi:MAG: polyphosphate polymerase domain-containing protein [Microbacterium gubbeenense]|uniref:polyphosphate polymerase domain-containing protein n=1 Tax=Microbacterium gubbeenense TaxID=159896 RepID=UPI003F9B53CF